MKFKPILQVVKDIAKAWNTEWLREQWASYADREAVSHACDGADLKGDNMALQFCFSPHLESIADGYSDTFADIVKLKSLGYYEWFRALAFCPCHLHGQGCRPKGIGWRRIASGCDPYEPVCDAEGVLALSINAATKLPYPSTCDSLGRRRWRVAGLAILAALLMAKVIFTTPDLSKAERVGGRSGSRGSSTQCLTRWSCAPSATL